MHAADADLERCPPGGELQLGVGLGDREVLVGEGEDRVLVDLPHDPAGRQLELEAGVELVQAGGAAREAELGPADEGVVVRVGEAEAVRVLALVGGGEVAGVAALDVARERDGPEPDRLGVRDRALADDDDLLELERAVADGLLGPGGRTQAEQRERGQEAGGAAAGVEGDGDDRRGAGVLHAPDDPQTRDTSGRATRGVPRP